LRGKGVNSTVFWVTHDIKGDWIQLPDVEPVHIMGARMIKKMLTGNLNAPIDSCPPFMGKERNLLRAQIARI
jgi:radial spoke head protein 4A